jgi:outer membrane lipoprotein carrier protein
MIIGACLLFVSTTLSAQNAAPNNVSEVAERVDRNYNNLQSLKAEFTETYRSAGVERRESGTVWLKQPGKMRWEYRQPAEKLFVTDGKTAWFYISGEPQARKAPVKKLDDLRSPLRYLLGKTKLQKEFDGLSLAPDVQPMIPGDVVLRGVPKSMADRVERVLLEVNATSQIDRIVIEEADGSVTEFRFTNAEQNAAVADQRFRFIPPAGVQVLEAAELSPQ